MISRLSYDEIFFDFNIDGIHVDDIDSKEFMEYKDIYSRFKMAINIKEPSFNIFLVDDCSEDKIEQLIHIIKEKEENLEIKDFAYVCYGDSEKIKLKTFKAGNGRKVGTYLEHIKKFYLDLIFEFYNSYMLEENNNILSKSLEKRDIILQGLIEIGLEKGFKIVYGDTGFSFIPIINEDTITEEEFDSLDLTEKNKIMESLKGIKNYTKSIIKELKSIEDNYLEEIKGSLGEFLQGKSKKNKEDIKNEFMEDVEGQNLLLEICNDIEENLSNNAVKSIDENEGIIISNIAKYKFKLLVENKPSEVPVVYEKFPTYKNIFGNMEYKNKKGSYKSSIDGIKGGSLLKANCGYLILEAKNLLEDVYAYNELKKVLKGKKLKFEENRGMLEFLAVEKLNLEEIPIDVKVILIGNYKYFNALYNYDEDFKNLFKIRLESDSIIKIDDYSKKTILKNMLQICKKYKCKPLTNKAVKEVGRLFSREAEDRDKIDFNYEKLKDIMILTSAYAVEEGKRGVVYEDIMNIYNKESLIEKYIKEEYKNGKIILNVEGERIGEINGLSVIQGNDLKIGRPMRITCTCSKGNGDIIDSQKENNLSGKVHNKSVSILKGLLNNLMGGYNEIPVDFNISFEQVYGFVEGDSASVAEALVMISSLLRTPIRQNIAVTGSINQFGDIQPVGGINHKIEGFYDTCKAINTMENKGVLIPSRNKDNIVLRKEVEDAIGEGKFSIYTMENFFDAMEVMFYEVNFRNRNIIEEIGRELKKYNGKKDKK